MKVIYTNNGDLIPNLVMSVSTDLLCWIPIVPSEMKNSQHILTALRAMVTSTPFLESLSSLCELPSLAATSISLFSSYK